MNAFPYPRTATEPESLIRPVSAYNASMKHRALRHSIDGVLFKSQYFDTERALIEVFRFIAPSNDNAATYSTVLAGIIKNSANLYELVSIWLYRKLFDCRGAQLRVKHFLSLNKYTRASEIRVDSYQFIGDFDNAEIHLPFKNLGSWDEASLLSDSNVPAWWNSYNKLKHSNDGLAVHATLGNAIASVAANFAVLHAIFGPGMVTRIDIDESGRILQEEASKLFVTERRADGI